MPITEQKVTCANTRYLTGKEVATAAEVSAAIQKKGLKSYPALYNPPSLRIQLSGLFPATELWTVNVFEELLHVYRFTSDDGWQLVEVRCNGDLVQGAYGNRFWAMVTT